MDRISTAVVSLGSNQGDRRAHLVYAIHALEGFLQGVRASSLTATPPLPPARPDDPEYLNAVAIGSTMLPPREVLDHLLRIERARGRRRPHAGSPRTLDLDLVLLGDYVVKEEGLELPHPRFRERRFVLEPLVTLAPDLVDPVTGLTVKELLTRIGPTCSS